MKKFSQEMSVYLQEKLCKGIDGELIALKTKRRKNTGNVLKLCFYCKAYSHKANYKEYLVFKTKKKN